ncbi:ribonuclease E [Pseudonocardia thermophila]|uniref:Ribonuclease E n=1 Tax=Pseudonocardia thermophila TaxID=1848 RepID=A0A1M7A8E0_PSETH|nr:translation initiation factor IF-2 N-terminal domain-containing protein [Pseudonocardia thermophila]SHL39017.1 ribonuclease E [Pseudonocardia thermophila]
MSKSDAPAGSTGGPVTVPAAVDLDALPDKMRVHALAKLIGRTSREVLTALADLGIEAKSPQSGIDRKTAEQVIGALLPAAEDAEPAAETESPAASAAESPAESAAEDPRESAAEESSEAAPAAEPVAAPARPAPMTPVFAPPTPLFQPPDPTAKRVRVATAEVDGDAEDVAEEPARRRRVRRRSEPVEELPDTAAETDVDADVDADAEGEAAEQAGSDEESIEGGTRRRRRRGRRGRGRGRGLDEANGESGEDERVDTTAEVGAEVGAEAGAGVGAAAAAPDADEADETVVGETSEATDESASDEDSAEGDGEENDDETGEQPEGSTTRRRRRRRRRRGSVDEVTEVTEEDGTVVKVRPAREVRDEREDDGVQSVRGSTRLEAKRQRRRDGRDAGRRRSPILSEAEFLARRESVERTMVVREHGDRVQIAVLEDGVLVEHFVAGNGRDGQKSLVGNVYLGRVQNVLPSMEAAFVDIGRGRNAVLYAGEVDWDAAGLNGKARRIEQALQTGDSVLVQVTKDPVGHKGARLTTQISLAGRFLVYVPSGGAAGISRKLPDVERKRLKEMLKEIVPPDAGVIIRTASEGVSHEALERDVRRLQAQWEVVKAKAEATGPNKPKAPALLYEEPDLIVKVVRDQFNEDFSSLIVQGDDAWDTVYGYVSHVAPELMDRVHRHTGPEDVFAAYRIDEQLMKALDRKVWLPSGGTLVIDRTEAMTVIDVNTGKFTGSGGNLEETVTRNNLEAAEEIVRQLRLRDIGGIIVIDFIDMVLEANRDLVLRRLTECLARDRTRHQVAEVTSLGLVQMTRKRVGGGLLEHFSTPCEHCRGRGVIVSTEPVLDRQSGDGDRGGRRNRNRGRRGDEGGNGANGASSPSAPVRPRGLPEALVPAKLPASAAKAEPEKAAPANAEPEKAEPAAKTEPDKTAPDKTAPDKTEPDRAAPEVGAGPVPEPPAEPTPATPEPPAAAQEPDPAAVPAAAEGAAEEDAAEEDAAEEDAAEEEAAEDTAEPAEPAPVTPAVTVAPPPPATAVAAAPTTPPPAPVVAPVSEAPAPAAGPVPAATIAPPPPATASVATTTPSVAATAPTTTPATGGGSRPRRRVTRTAGAPTVTEGPAPVVAVVTLPAHPTGQPAPSSIPAPVVPEQPEPTVTSRPRRARRAASRPAGPPVGEE